MHGNPNIKLPIGLNIPQIFARICAFSNTNRLIDPKAFYCQRSSDQR